MKSDVNKRIFIINKTLTLLEFLNFTSFDQKIWFFEIFGKVTVIIVLVGFQLIAYSSDPFLRYAVM